MFHHPLTEADLKVARYLRAVRAGALAQYLFSFFLTTLKKMPQYSERKIKTREICLFNEEDSGRLLSSFINNPTLTRRNVLCAISISCGNFQDDLTYQLWLHDLVQAQTCLAWFCFPFRPHLQTVLDIFHHTKYVYLGLQFLTLFNSNFFLSLLYRLMK